MEIVLDFVRHVFFELNGMVIFYKHRMALVIFIALVIDTCRRNQRHLKITDILIGILGPKTDIITINRPRL